ncbi:MAG: hypothetical protein ACLTD0_05950 [Coprococcus comes]
MKSSSAAKLFNAVHKAQVSWKRIRPLMHPQNVEKEQKIWEPGELNVRHLSFAYPGGERVRRIYHFRHKRTDHRDYGPVACGKSTLGKAFLCEYPYEGKIQFAGRELQDMKEQERTGIAGYLGHDPELFMTV